VSKKLGQNSIITYNTDITTLGNAARKNNHRSRS